MGNYVITSYSDHIRPIPEPESYDTLEEAAQRLLDWIHEQAPLTDRFYSLSKELCAMLKVKIVTLDDAMRSNWKNELDVPKIVALFKEHPSMRINANVYVGEWSHDCGAKIIHCTLQGIAEVQHYMDTDPSMQSLKKTLGAIGATGVTGSGIVVGGVGRGGDPKLKKKRKKVKK